MLGIAANSFLAVDDGFGQMVIDELTSWLQKDVTRGKLLRLKIEQLGQLRRCKDLATSKLPSNREECLRLR